MLGPLGTPDRPGGHEGARVPSTPQVCPMAQGGQAHMCTRPPARIAHTWVLRTCLYTHICVLGLPCCHVLGHALRLLHTRTRATTATLPATSCTLHLPPNQRLSPRRFLPNRMGRLGRWIANLPRGGRGGVLKAGRGGG